MKLGRNFREMSWVELRIRVVVLALAMVGMGCAGLVIFGVAMVEAPVASVVFWLFGMLFIFARPAHDPASFKRLLAKLKGLDARRMRKEL